LLRSFYFFDIRDRSEQGVEFIKRNFANHIEIDSKDFIPEDNKIYSIRNIASRLKIHHIIIKYFSIEEEYSASVESVFDEDITKQSYKVLNVPFIMSSQVARRIAKILVDHSDSEKAEISIKLPINYLAISPCDILKFTIDNLSVELRVVEIEIKKWEIKICGIIEKAIDVNLNSNYFFTNIENDSDGIFEQIVLPSNFTYDGAVHRNYIYFVNSFRKIKGLYVSSCENDYIKIADVRGGSSVGIITYIQIDGEINQYLIDEASFIDIYTEGNMPLIFGRSLWNCNSLVLCGDMLLYAKNVHDLGDGNYRLNELIFVLYEDINITAHTLVEAGARVVFLDRMLAISYADEFDSTDLYYISHKGDARIV